MRRLFLSLILFALTASVAVSQQADSATLVFIRHAEKVDDGTNDPVLTKEGEARALKVSTILTKKFGKISAVYSTNYKRTKLTATPTALKNNVKIIEYDPRAPNVFLKSLVRNHIGEVVLVVGHSNTTPTLVNLILGTEKFKPLDEKIYDSIFIVKSSEVGRGKVVLDSSN